MNNNALVAKLWKMCDTLRDGGVSYQNYVNELASLLFLKMCEETEQENDLLPEGFRWKDLKSKLGLEQHQFYRNMLVQLGADEHAIVRAIFQNVNTTITQPAQLSELIASMDRLEWFEGKQGKSRDDFGDMYEGLLEKNANETKSGAGQYFTPRSLIKTMVKLLDPKAGEVIQDPAAGTAGFLIEADKHIKAATHDLDDLSDDEQEFQIHNAFVGLELVPETRRLALMNCLLHDIEGENGGAIRLGNTLGGDGENLPSANLILTNPPFGSAAGTNITRKFVNETNNKQLCFMQHIIDALEPGGRAGVVIPDNVLFEAGVGTEIRKDLMERCSLDAILRLPTGIFYAAGVKTNVLFLTKGTAKKPTQDTKCTTHTWVYDLRTNMPSFGKRTPFGKQHLEPFENAFTALKAKKWAQPTAQPKDVKGSLQWLAQTITKTVKGKATQKDVFSLADFSLCEEGTERTLENSRLQCFSRDYIRDTKADSLDISWLKDKDSVDAADLPEPDVLAAEAMTELTEALRELDLLMTALGATGQAKIQKDLLADALGLADTATEEQGAN
ncbi:MAG: N-6 DNA methylase [Colwellia sp.]|jgi:Type I restriction-modification system methyltransferase subunit